MSSPVSAATYYASSSNLLSTFATVKSGDTIVLRGNIAASRLKDRSFSSAVTINANNATFVGQLIVDNVRNLRIIGGKFGSPTAAGQRGGAVRVHGGTNINFFGPSVVGNGLLGARGLLFHGTQGAEVSNGKFNGLRQAIGVNDVTQSRFSGNQITNATSDGINVVNSHFVTVSGNTCRATNPSPLAHPDCVQLWSIAGQPVQSDIRIIDNQAFGRTQGFTSFDPDRGGGLRITMSGNYVNTTLPQGMACYNCRYSSFTNNTLITAPGARYQTRLSVIGGYANTISNNSIGPKPTATNLASAFQIAGSAAEIGSFDADTLGSRSFSSDSFGTAGSVPEPMTWLQMLFGFALIGIFSRRRTAATA